MGAVLSRRGRAQATRAFRYCLCVCGMGWEDVQRMMRRVDSGMEVGYAGGGALLNELGENEEGNESDEPMMSMLWRCMKGS